MVRIWEEGTGYIFTTRTAIILGLLGGGDAKDKSRIFHGPDDHSAIELHAQPKI